jgi:hypothetical protein
MKERGETRRAFPPQLLSRLQLEPRTGHLVGAHWGSEDRKVLSGRGSPLCPIYLVPGLSTCDLSGVAHRGSSQVTQELFVPSAASVPLCQRG